MKNEENTYRCFLDQSGGLITTLNGHRHENVTGLVEIPFADKVRAQLDGLRYLANLKK